MKFSHAYNRHRLSHHSLVLCKVSTFICMMKYKSMIDIKNSGFVIYRYKTAVLKADQMKILKQLGYNYG